MGKRIQRILKILSCNSEDKSQIDSARDKTYSDITCKEGETDGTLSTMDRKEISDNVEALYNSIKTSLDSLKERLEKHDEELTKTILSYCDVTRDHVNKRVADVKNYSSNSLEEGIDEESDDVLQLTSPRRIPFMACRSIGDSSLICREMAHGQRTESAYGMETGKQRQPQALKDISKRLLVSMVYENLRANRLAGKGLKHYQTPKLRSSREIKIDNLENSSAACEYDKDDVINPEEEFGFGMNARIYDMFSRNNNHPGVDDDGESDSPIKVSIHQRSASQDSQGSSSSFRDTLGASSGRSGKNYFLFPIGSFSSTATSPVFKWKDVGSIIPTGVKHHKNIDLKKFNRYERPVVTISQGILTSSYIKARAYAVKRIKPPVVYMDSLLEKNAHIRIFQETHAKFVCVNLMMALRFLHEHDIAPGSICPKKVILNEKGYPCLTGFETAEVIHDRPSRPRGRIDVEYSSSEQIYQDCVSATTDIYSLGVLTYHMIYGRPPHRGKNLADTRRNALDKHFEPPFRPEPISKEGKKFIMKCIRKYDDRRFNILHQKLGLFDSVSWFGGLNEEKLYKQSVPSPLLSIMSEQVSEGGSLKD